MSERGDGPWDAPTEHDDRSEEDRAELSGDDPPTVRASDAQRARAARDAAIAEHLVGGAPRRASSTGGHGVVNANVIGRPATVPPPAATTENAPSATTPSATTPSATTPSATTPSATTPSAKPTSAKPTSAKPTSETTASVKPAPTTLPPPITQRAPAKPGEPVALARRTTTGTAPVPLATKTPAPGLLPILEDATRADEPPRVDERYSSESITSLPSPPSMSARPPADARPRTGPIATADSPSGPVALVDTRSRPIVTNDRRTGPARARTASGSPLPRHPTGDPRDLAVVASDDDVKRVQKLAKKLRLELSAFTKIADVPEHLPVVTVGETWSSNDGRVLYAARSQLSDEQLGDLLTALVYDRVVALPAPLTKPQSTSDARRSQLAFAGARKLAATTDLAAAEAIATQTIHDLLDTDRAYCFFVEPGTGALWSETRRRNGGDDRHTIAGIAGWVARTGRAANVPRASADPRWLGPIDDPDGDPNSQLLVHPLVRTDERVHGVLIAARRARRPGFTEADAALFARFAALAAPLFEQIDIASQAQQMLGEDASPRAPLPAAPASPLQAILRGTTPLARWLFLVLGLVAGLVLGLLL